MKKIYLIGILVFLLVSVSFASAEGTSVTLTEDNSNVNRDDPGTLPDGIINVQVTYNPGTGTITYADSSSTDPADGTYLVNPRIDEVAYSLPMAGNVLQPSWGSTGNTGMDGFGSFTHKYVESPRNDRYRTVTVQLEGPAPYPSFSSSGNVVAVHLAFEKAYYNNQLIMESGSVNLGSTYLAGGVTSVPEFPSVTLPLAAIIGIMFIFGRGKKS